MQALAGTSSWSTGAGALTWRFKPPGLRGPVVALVTVAMTVAVSVVISTDTNDRTSTADAAATAAGSLVAPGETPAGLTSAEWTSIQEQIAAARAVNVAPALVAGAAGTLPNDTVGETLRLQTAGLVAEFTAGSAAVASDEAATSDVTFSTARLGDLPATEPAATAIANGVEYRHAPGVTEWFRSTPDGLQQGFTLEAPISETSAFDITVGVAGGIPTLVDSQTVSIARPGQSALAYRDLIAWDTDGVMLPTSMSVDGDTIVLSVDATGATYPITVDPLITEQDKLLPTPDAAGDRFGESVAIDGVPGDMTIVVGARLDDDQGAQYGTAYVFHDDGTGWVQRATLYPDTPGDIQFGWDVDVHVDALGDETIAVGAPGDDTNGLNAGAVYIFEPTGGGAWQQTSKVYGCDPGVSSPCGASTGVGADLAGAQFGFAVDLSEQYLVVGAPGSASDTGTAAIYLRNGSDWDTTVDRQLSGAALLPGDRFGYAVSSADAGTHIVVGAPGVDILAGLDAGASFYQQWDGVSLSAPVLLTNGNTVDGDAGAAVAVELDLDGDVVTFTGEPVNTRFEDGTEPGPGHTWQLVLPAGEPPLSANFDSYGSSAWGDGQGRSIGFTGEHLLFGVYLNDSIAPDAGGVHTWPFDSATNNWGGGLSQSLPFASAGDQWGFDVAAEGDVFVMSGPGSDVAGPDSGQIRVRSFSNFATDITLVPQVANHADRYGHAVAIDGNRMAVSAINDDRGATNAGAVYLYTRLGEFFPWTADGVILNPFPEENARFGDSVALLGDRVAIGESDRFGDQGEAGRVYVFERTGAATWTPFGSALAIESGVGGYDAFGASIAWQDSTTLVVGAPATALDTGAVYHVTFGGSVWNTPEALASVVASSPGDQLGYAVDVSEERTGDFVIVAGAPGFDNPAPVYTNSGALHIFRDTGAGAAGLQVVQAGAGWADGDRMGTAVASNNGYLAVAGVGAQTPGSDLQAYLLEPIGSNFLIDGAFTSTLSVALDADANDYIDLVGRNLFLSRPGGGGQVGVFRDIDGLGFPSSPVDQFIPNDQEPGDAIGFSVATDGRFLLVGAPGDDDLAGPEPLLTGDSGAAYTEASLSLSHTFIAASGDWTDPNNWDTGLEPQSNETAIIPAGAVVTVSTPFVEIGSLVIAPGGQVNVASGGQLVMYSAPDDVPSKIGGTLRVQSGGVLDAPADFTFTGGTLENLDGGTVTIHASDEGVDVSGNGIWDNAGTFNKIGGFTVTIGSGINWVSAATSVISVQYNRLEMGITTYPELGEIRVAPGATIRFADNLLLDPGARLRIEIDGPSATPGSYGAVEALGSPSLIDGTLIADLLGYAPTVDDIYPVMTCGFCQAFGTTSVAPLSATVAADTITLALPPGNLLVDTLADTVAADGSCSLREAINAANANTTGTDCGDAIAADIIAFTVSGTIALASRLPVITSDIRIDGTGQSIELSGQTSASVLRIDSGNVDIFGIDILDGRGQTCPTTPGGGGTDNCGAVLNYGSLTLDTVTFRDNVANSGTGGAIANRGSGVLAVNNSTFENNGATFNAGAIWNVGTATIGNSTFVGNGDGTVSALYNFNNPASTIISNSTFVGGGTLLNATGTLTLFNTIVDAPGAGDCTGTITADGFNIDTDGTCGSAATSTSLDLDLEALADNGGPTETVALGAASSAIGAGDPTVCSAAPVLGVDQRGVTRAPTGCDVGAFAVPTYVVDDLGDGGDANPGDMICETAAGNGVCTLRAAIDESNASPDTDRIHFDIDGVGVPTISPASALPATAGPVIIDALTQPGATCATWPPTITVELDLTNAGAGGLVLGSDTAVRGFAIDNMTDTSVTVNGDGNRLECNFIGSNDLANPTPDGFYGVTVNGSDNTIGGPAATQANLIVGGGVNTSIQLFGDGNVVQGNHINVSLAGDPYLLCCMNQAIWILGSDNLVGGPNPGEGNLLGLRVGRGVAAIQSLPTYPATGNRIRGNSMVRDCGGPCNATNLGIDLENDYTVAVNDVGDVDGGANNLQNYPVVTTAVDFGGSVQVVGTFDSTPSSTFEIDVYSNTVCNASGFGEGETYLGLIAVTTDGSGTATFDTTFPVGLVPGSNITTTATDVTTGDTSEFSECVAAIDGATPVPANKILSSVASERFAAAVDIDGDTAVVAEIGFVGAESALYVLERDPISGAWSIAERQSFNTPPFDSGVRDIAVSGNVMAAVAVSGEVRIWERSGPGSNFVAATVTPGYAGMRSIDTDGTGVFAAGSLGGTLWTKDVGGIWQPANSASAPSTDYGRAVAIDGSVIVVSEQDDNVVSDGSVYVYERTGSVWSGPTDVFTAPAGSTNDGFFGSAVAVQGSTMVIGQRLEDNDLADPHGVQGDAGAAWVYTGTPGDGWAPPVKLVPGDSGSANQFGSSVAIDGPNIVVGASAAEETGVPTRNGAAYVYRRTPGGLWVEADTLRAADQEDGASFGESIGVSDDRIIVGAPFDDNANGINAGAAYMFDVIIPDNPTLSFTLGLEIGQEAPTIAGGAGIPISRLSTATPLIESKATTSGGIGSTALDATGVSESALKGTQLGETPFGAIAVSNDDLANLPITSIGLDLDNGDDWPQILDTPEFADRPIVNIKVGEVFGSTDTALRGKLDAIPFGAIDVGGTPFGAIPFGAIALGGVPLTQIPPSPDLTTPAQIEDAWCDILDGTSEACNGGVLDPGATLLSISLSDVPFGAIPFGAIPFGAIPVADAPFGAIELGTVEIQDTPFGAIPFGAIPFGAIDINASPFGAIPFGAIPFGAIPFGAIDIDTVGVGGTPFGAIPFGAIPFGAIDVNGAPFGAIPFGAIALADVNLGDIPLDPDRSDPSEITADWCALMAEYGLDCTNSATSVADTTITELGVRGVPFGAIPFGAIPYDSVPFGAIPFGAIQFSAIPFGAINLNAVDIDEIDLAGTPFGAIPFGAIPFGAISTSVGAIPFGAIDVQGSPFGAIRLEDIDTEATPFGAIPFGAIPFGAISPDAVPFGAIPFGAIPFGAIGTVGETPFGAIDLVDSPFGAIPFGAIPFGAIDAIVDCTAIDCASNASLRDAFLAGAIRPDATLSDLGSAADDFRLPDLAEHLLGISAQELYDAVAAWGANLTLDDLDSFANMTLGDLPVDHPLFRNTVLSDVKAGLSTVSFEDLALALLLSTVADPAAELETVVDGFGAGLTLADFDTFGDTTFSELLPAFGGGQLGDLGAFLAFIHLGDLGFDPADVAAALATGGSGTNGAWLVRDAINSGLDLGDMKIADIIGAPEWGAATVLDLVNSLPADEVEGFTFSDLLLGMLPPGALPWGLAFEKIDAKAIPGVMPPITLQSEFALTGTRTRSVEVSVELPTNAAYLPGSTQVTPAVGTADVEPVEVDGRLIWTFTGIQPGPDSVTPGQQYTMTFDVQPTLTIGSTAVNADSRIVGVPSSVAATTLLQVLEAFEPNNVPSQAVGVEENVIYLVHVPDETDIDLFSVDVLENDALAVDLSGLPADFDVVVYRETTAPVSASALTRSIAAEPLVPLLDPDADGSETVPDQSFPRLDLTYPNLSLVDLSNSRGLDKETIVTDRLPAGRYIIQVHGHDGAHSAEPAVLQINVIEAGEVPECTVRGSLPSASPGAPLDLASLPADLDTVILLNEMRFEQIYGTAGRTQVTTSLAELANAMGSDPEIATLGLSAIVVAVDGSAAVRDAYAFWDDPASHGGIAEDACNPASANDVVSTIISEVLDPIRDVRDIDNIVLVGSDDLLPFGRLADATQTANEFDYRNDLAGRNAFTGAFWSSTFLSDDPYAETGALPYGDRFLYVPDAALGRVLETPAQIASQVEQFITFDGYLAAETGLIAGYDFLIDGSEAIADELRSDGAVPIVDDELADGTNATGAPWTATDISDALLANVPTGENGFDLVSFNAHFDHYRALPAAGDGVSNFNANFESSSISGLTLNDQRLDGTVIFSMGCHSGLNVPNTGVGVTGVTEDWAEVFTEQRAIYVGNTGFGYGDTETVGFTERLMQLFARNVASPVADDVSDASTTTSIGDAMRFAKQEVFSELGDVSVYHEKAYQESTFYGLPFFRVGVAPVLKQPAPDNEPEIEELTGTPASAFEVDAANSPNVVDTVVGGVVVKTETYYSNLNGAGDRVTITQPGRPIQPGVSIDVTDVDPTDSTRLEREALGAIILDMSSTYVEIDPVLSVPVFDLSSASVEPKRDDIVYPTVPGRVTTSDRPEGARQNLVLATGQYRGTESLGAQRLDDDIDIVVYYADPSSTDRTAPRILSVDTNLDGQDLSVTAHVEDTGGVDRVYVLVTASPNEAQAEWVGIDLTDDGSGRWVGGYSFASTPDEIELLVQAKDETGNVGVSTNKARNFGDETKPPPPVSTLTTTLTPDPAGPLVNGFYTGPVTVTADAGGTPIQYRVDSVGGFQDLDLVNGVVVSGDRAHTVEIVAIDGQRSTRTFKIDTAPPTVTISKPVALATYSAGQVVTSSFQCIDASGASCSGVVTRSGATVATLANGQALPTATPGTYTLTVTGTDPVGRTATAVRSYNVGGDLAVSVTPAGGTSLFGDTYDGPVTVEAAAAGLPVTYTENGGPSQPMPAGGIDVTADGDYVFAISTSAQTETVSFTIDSTGPVVTITSPDGDVVGVGDTGLVATFDCTDALSEPSTCTASLTGPVSVADVTSGDALPTSAPGTYILTVVGSDAVGNESVAAAAYEVFSSSTPEVVAISVPATPQLITDGADIDVDFTDADGTSDSYTITIDYGDADPDDPASTSTVCTVSSGAPVTVGAPSCELTQEPDPGAGQLGTVSSHVTYPRSGVFVVNVTVTDAAGNVVTAAADDFVVVYDPDAGRVSGSGFFWSDDSSYADANPWGELAYFGYGARYKKNSDTPVGTTKLKLLGAFNFTSTSYDYLIINDTMAIAEGVGKIGRRGGYRFRVQGVDNGRTDFFQITIWEDGNPDNVVYDNGIIFDENGDSVGDKVLLGGIRIKS